MKRQLLTASFFLTFGVADAQITLTQSSFPSSVFGSDTMINTTVGSTNPTLSSTASDTWDLSTVTDTTAPYFLYRVPTTYYQFADSNFYSFGSYSYQGNVQSSITSSGLYDYGVIIQRTAYHLPTGASDSLIILAQSDTFTSPDKVLQFPATYNTTWGSTYQSSFNFQLSVSILSYNHAPGVVKSYVVETDSVKGWGKMRVKTLTGGASSYFNVLQVQRTVATTDSFFVNGALANPTLLSELGFTQGQTTTEYLQDYYRTEKVAPFAEAVFSSSAFGRPVVIYTNVENLVNESVPNVPNAAGVRMYPNPASGVVSIELPFNGSWSYELMDISGRIAQKGALNPSGTLAQLPLADVTAAGVYYIRLSNDGNPYAVLPLEIAK